MPEQVFSKYQCRHFEGDDFSTGTLGDVNIQTLAPRRSSSLRTTLLWVASLHERPQGPLPLLSYLTLTTDLFKMQIWFPTSTPMWSSQVRHKTNESPKYELVKRYCARAKKTACGPGALKPEQGMRLRGTSGKQQWLVHSSRWLVINKSFPIWSGIDRWLPAINLGKQFKFWAYDFQGHKQDYDPG